MSFPQLLYHNPSAIPYPTNTRRNALAIRFPTPVRVASIRICPEGVQSLSGIGSTYPASWRGTVYVNISGGNVVNALAKSEIVVKGGDWEEDFEIGMPEDVTTRLMILETPAEILTLSIYGYPSSSNYEVQLPPAQSTTSSTRPREQYTWLSAWANGTSGLFGLLTLHTPVDVMERALACLDMLADTPDNSILPVLLSHPTALVTLLTMLDNPPALLRRLLEDPSYSLHPKIQALLPNAHHLKINTFDAVTQRQAAWRDLESGKAPLTYLAGDVKAREDLLLVTEGQTQTNLFRLVNFANAFAVHTSRDSTRSLELVLDILSHTVQDHIAQRYLARVLPRLYVISRMRGSSRQLLLNESHDDMVLGELLQISTDIIDGKSALEPARQLAVPLLGRIPPDHPLATAWKEDHAFSETSKGDLTSETPGIQPSNSPQIPLHITTIEERQARSFAQALRTPHAQFSARQYSLTPQQILSVIAPNLLKTLQTAPVPLLGIQSTLIDATPESQASAWGGKVYTDHEFRRNRLGDENTRGSVGLGIGIAGRKDDGVGGSLGANDEGGGLGFGAGPFRSASRHVDHYRA